MNCDLQNTNLDAKILYQITVFDKTAMTISHTNFCLKNMYVFVKVGRIHITCKLDILLVKNCLILYTQPHFSELFNRQYIHSYATHTHKKNNKKTVQVRIFTV